MMLVAELGTDTEEFAECECGGGAQRSVLNQPSDDVLERK